MRILLLFIFLFSSSIIFSQSDWNSGYEKGFKKGYCNEDPACLAPIPGIPSPPLYGSSYSEGFTQGVIDGAKAKNGSSSGASGRSGRRQIVSNGSSSGASGGSGRRQIVSSGVNTNAVAQAGAPQNTTGEAMAQIGNIIGNIAANMPPPPPEEEPTKLVKLPFEKDISGYKHLFIETKGDEQMKTMKLLLKNIKSNTIIEPLDLSFLERKYGKWNLKRNKIIEKIKGFDSSKMLHLVIIYEDINVSNFKATIALRDFKTKEIFYVAEHKNLAKDDDFFFFLRKPKKEENLNDLFN